MGPDSSCFSILLMVLEPVLNKFGTKTVSELVLKTFGHKKVSEPVSKQIGYQKIPSRSGKHSTLVGVY